MTEFSRVATASILCLTLVTASMTEVEAAELNVLAGGSTAGWLAELARDFERTSGHKLVIHFDSTPNLIKRAVSGCQRLAVRRYPSLSCSTAPSTSNNFRAFSIAPR